MCRCKRHEVGSNLAPAIAMLRASWILPLSISYLIHRSLSLVLAGERALELWRLQTEAKIEGMMRRGEPLGAVAAALASHETAERIAVLEAATSGGLTPVQAARLNVRRAGGDVQLLDDLHAHGKTSSTAPMPDVLDASDTQGLAVPFAPALNGHQHN
jgi:hypothetical protein